MAGATTGTDGDTVLVTVELLVRVAVADGLEVLERVALGLAAADRLEVAVIEFDRVPDRVAV